MWLRVFEVWLTSRLLASPTFHRAVQSLHKRVHQLRHGKDPSEMGGTNIEESGPSGSKDVFQYFVEELKDQFRGGPPKK
ncbi:MAG: hypothetical protein M1824_004207 [Vezdaea acicularis]|nr:MAG: hypothetical protein M1824_004207 [Vezdaea acicularis]